MVIQCSLHFKGTSSARKIWVFKLKLVLKYVNGMIFMVTSMVCVTNGWSFEIEASSKMEMS